jgi:tetratricopeptide (TPR) repeat protein
MRCLSLAALIAVAIPATTSSAPDEPLLLGPICHGEPPPSIAGPHKLVMLSGMGNDHMRADTTSADAQRWFDYGLTLGRSFEHADAVLAFQRAQTADPNCSLCVWGEAWAAGPNINFPPPPSETPRLLALAKQARALAGPAVSETSRGLEAALIDRYSGEAGDLAYARDLDVLQRAHPDDVEVAIWDAEAWLIMENQHDDPSGPTRGVQVLGPLLPRHPDNTGLIHFYVHATEDAGLPELAAPYAAKLAALAPAASHMVHMPSHIWFRLGRYEAAAQANVSALDADLAYAKSTDWPTPLGRITYHSHDIKFGLAAAMMSGDGSIAMKLVRQFDQDYPTPATYEPQAIGPAGETFAAFGRFAAPQAVLAAPDTVAVNPFLEAMRHYARGEAYLRLGQADRVRTEAALVVMPASAVATSRVVRLTDIARLTLQGDAALLAHQPAAAVDPFTKAARIQEAFLVQDSDPPAWWYPVRRSLAAALLAEGDAAGAVREASTVLQSWKLDPVALTIRAEAERKLGRPNARQDEAAARSGWRGDIAQLRADAAA